MALPVLLSHVPGAAPFGISSVSFEDSPLNRSLSAWLMTSLWGSVEESKGGRKRWRRSMLDCLMASCAFFPSLAPSSERRSQAVTPSVPQATTNFEVRKTAWRERSSSSRLHVSLRTSVVLLMCGTVLAEVWRARCGGAELRVLRRCGSALLPVALGGLTYGANCMLPRFRMTSFSASTGA